MRNRISTFIRVIVFWLVCAVTLATFSGLTKNLESEWKHHLLLIFSVVVTACLAIFFAKWEKLRLDQIGLIPRKASAGKLAAGLGIGLLMTSLQPLFVILAGHYNTSLNDSMSYDRIFFYLLLYILVAVREEIAFRSYPLFTLYYSFGFWKSQLMILIIFSLEHIAGGMTWVQAFLGAGTGALLFGLAAIRTRGIALPVGLHIAWNFGQWCFGFKNEPGLVTGIADKGFENVVERNGWISYLLIMTVAIIGFYLYKPKTNPFLLR